MTKVVTSNSIGKPWSGPKPDNRRKMDTDKKTKKKR